MDVCVCVCVYVFVHKNDSMDELKRGRQREHCLYQIIHTPLTNIHTHTHTHARTYLCPTKRNVRMILKMFMIRTKRRKKRVLLPLRRELVFVRMYWMYMGRTVCVCVCVCVCA